MKDQVHGEERFTTVFHRLREDVISSRDLDIQIITETELQNNLRLVTSINGGTLPYNYMGIYVQRLTDVKWETTLFHYYNLACSALCPTWTLVFGTYKPIPQELFKKHFEIVYSDWIQKKVLGAGFQLIEMSQFALVGLKQD